VTADAPVRVATYCRISTDETNQPYSLGAQRDRLEAYVASQPSWHIVARYVDRASAKSLERPDLARARAAAAAGAFDLLLTYRVDRLSRNVAQLGALIEELQAAGVAYRSATEPFETATPAGLMMLQMLGVFAQFERSSIVERIAAGMERKAKGGGWTVGSYPYGYRRLDGRPGLVPDPAAAPLVREIFHRYAEDRQGSAAIASELNARGLRTRYGDAWSRTAILDVLRNRVYVGEVPFRRIWYVGQHEPPRRAGAVRGGRRDPGPARRGARDTAHGRLGLPPLRPPHRVRPVRPSVHRGGCAGPRWSPLRLLHLLCPEPLRPPRMRPGAPAQG
jgi:site-specific DNA recombinase